MHDALLQVTASVLLGGEDGRRNRGRDARAVTRVHDSGATTHVPRLTSARSPSAVPLPRAGVEDVKELLRLARRRHVSSSKELTRAYAGGYAPAYAPPGARRGAPPGAAD
ncbi:hypothetical protein GCM10010393_55290 [Streptomyces gobitricini]|uniref:Ribbon-helix-helix protein CopG domain-containing protein n=1 Tax=Streptomyces gobitricini TaxID=68211 RepID=A0ABN3N5Y8_9ACTN